jgi:TRAP-type C4-dicarboxylate transport system substrate-binding protein
MRKMLIIWLILIITSMLVIIPVAFAAEKKEHKAVELKIWTAWPVKKSPGYPANHIFMDLVNKHGKEVNLSAKIIGGPEVFGSFEGVEAQLAGAYDIAFTVPSYYVGVVPEAYATMLNEHTRVESRKLGIVDLMDQFHQRKGLKYLAYYSGGGNFQAYTNFDTPKPDLKGRIMRTAPIYDPLVRALGGVPTTISPGEIYDALSRGVVNGFFWLNRGIQDHRWHEQVKYYWGQELPYIGDGNLLMNLRSWNKLDKDQQAVLSKLGEELENTMAEVCKKDVEKQYRELVTSGLLKHIKFSDADYKYYRKTARDTAWNYVLSKAPDAAKLRLLMEKKE